MKRESESHKCPKRCENLLSEANPPPRGLDAGLASSVAPFTCISDPLPGAQSKGQRVRAHRPGPVRCLLQILLFVCLGHLGFCLLWDLFFVFAIKVHRDTALAPWVTHRL